MTSRELNMEVDAMKRTALMIVATLSLLGCGGPGKDEQTFEKLKVERILPVASKTKTTITDSEVVAKIATFFPGVGQGKKSEIAAAWKAAYRLTFVPAEGEPVVVLVDSAGEAWTESQGDWPARPGLKAFLDSLFKKGSVGGAAG
jgi:hypothetical protein